MPRKFREPSPAATWRPFYDLAFPVDNSQAARRFGDQLEELLEDEAFVFRIDERGRLEWCQRHGDGAAVVDVGDVRRFHLVRSWLEQLQLTPVPAAFQPPAGFTNVDLADPLAAASPAVHRRRGFWEDHYRTQFARLQRWIDAQVQAGAWWPAIHRWHAWQSRSAVAAPPSGLPPTLPPRGTWWAPPGLRAVQFQIALDGCLLIRLETTVQRIDSVDPVDYERLPDLAHDDSSLILLFSPHLQGYQVRWR